ncbi:MAG: ABC transporter substrate-binding protein [Promethearchaeota archaeon]
MEKRNQYIAIGVIAIIAVAAGIGAGVYFMQGPAGPGVVRTDLNVAVGSRVRHLDVADSWDSISAAVEDQVAEPLYRYDLTSPTLDFVAALASPSIPATWSADNLNLTVPLRQGVKFHDGTPFNATAVKFSIDRYLYFLNVTGTLTSAQGGLANTAELYVWPDEAPYNTTFARTEHCPIINGTEIVSTYVVKIILNYPYALFMDLLSFNSMYIVSPTAYAAYATSRVPADDTGFIVGTGPYKFIVYEPLVDATFEANDDYWDGAPQIKDLTFTIISDDNARNIALLSGDVQFLNAPLPTMRPVMDMTPGITLEYGPWMTATQYMGMCTLFVNQTWRGAISWAMDYDYIIDNIMLGDATRLKNYVPAGLQFSNYTQPTPVLNLTKARQYLVDAGVVPAFYNDGVHDHDDFFRHTNGTLPPLATFNYTFNADNLVRGQIGILAADNLAEIGVKLTLVGYSFYNYLYRLYNIPGYENELELYFIGWIPDYNDPSNFINPLFTPGSSSNSAQVDDDILNAWMLDCLEETDPVARKQIFDKMQLRLLTVIMPWALCYNGPHVVAYDAGLSGFPCNTMGRYWIASMQWS